ncbi:uncharacterized protein LOC113763132 [Coffea eugenioides]|uniref:uncharacterized protein LOC113763132 n=1 Tax=Coffea eugenioides TaxID=49369 RepID=UPI000F605DD2|nr:uncharacterized protein LOC113763132 [Coffea eugenioides]
MLKTFVNLIVLCSLFLAAVVSSKHHGNPADDLVELINMNRTAHKLPELSNSPGLGCVALQCAEECQANCTSDNAINCHPSADDFTEIFAPNCGVELPTFGTITGHVVGCHHKDLTPSEAFSKVLFRDKKSFSLLGNRSHNEVGIGIFRAHKHKGPYLWCVLFSSSQTNTTFVLDDLGRGIKQKKGCYSGLSDACSRQNRNTDQASYVNICVMLFIIFFLSTSVR